MTRPFEIHKRPYLGSGLFALILCLCAARLSAQSSGPYPEIGWDLNFNHTDVMMGGHAGVCIPKWNASVLATFKGRLGTKRVLIEGDQPDVFYQYRERRYILGVQAEKRFILTEFSPSLKLGAFVGALGGLGISDYRGTKGQAPLGFAYSGMAGPYITDGETIVIRLGYQYLPLKTQNVFDHRLLLSISFMISA